jgi:HlyD family secretion protein
MDSKQPHSKSRNRAPYKASFRVLVVGLSVILIAGLGIGGAAWSGAFGFSRMRDADLATEAVKRGPLEIKVTERGNLESAQNLILRSFVEGGTGTSILKIVDEGTLVEKDQVVVELDSSRLRDEAAVQQIRLDTAEAALKTAAANAEIQKLQNESDIATAALQLELARLDLRAYSLGEHPQQKKMVHSDVEFAEKYLERAEQRQMFSERLMRRGFSTTKLLEAERVGVKKARIDLKAATEKERVLDQYAHRRDLTEKEANLTFLEGECERVKLRAEAAMIQRARNLLAARRTHFIESERHKKIHSQIAACTIRTPREGLVVHANARDGNRGPAMPRIYEGAVVRERQPIVELPDVGDIQVNVRIHESKIALIEQGLPATIHIDARADESFHGVVTDVALVPLSGTWPNPDRKEYVALVKLTDDDLEECALRPGLTAEVEILADRLESVLQAPIQSCIERGQRYFAWVLEDDDEPRRHEIRLGKSNDTNVEIVDGLAEGDEVVLNPRSALADEVALLESEIPADAEAEFDGPRPSPAPPREPRTPPARSSDGEAPGKSPGAPPTDTFAAKIADNEEPQPSQPASADLTVVFNWLDQDGDSRVSETELPERMKLAMSRIDTNGDKAIDREEWRKGARTLARLSEVRLHSGGGQ